MKIKSITALCRKEKTAILFTAKDNAHGTQWLGVNGAAYALDRLPYINVDTLCAIVDITEKKRKDWMIDEIPKLDEMSDINSADEQLVQPEQLTIGYAGRILVPIFTNRGLIYIRNEYLAPLQAEYDSDFSLFSRARGSFTEIVARVGFMQQAIIYPYQIKELMYARLLERLALGNCAALEARESGSFHDTIQQTLEEAGYTVAADGRTVTKDGEVLS
jgi:hypothetical protein